MTSTPTPPANHLRHHHATLGLGHPFGSGAFGTVAEALARFFGTPVYLVGQSLVVAAWVAFNAVVGNGFDPYPFILLNLAFSLQAAYAAPMILLAETRQAERDKQWSQADALHREDLSQTTLALLQQNTELTLKVQQLSERIAGLTDEIHSRIVTSR